MNSTKARVEIPLDKELVFKVLKKMRIKSLDDYLTLKIQEDLKRLT